MEINDSEASQVLKVHGIERKQSDTRTDVELATHFILEGCVDPIGTDSISRIQRIIAQNGCYQPGDDSVARRDHIK